MFRGQEGQAHVLNAYCPHLGANLAVGGRVVGNCIECPFHGWRFEGSDGKCVKIPYAENGMTGDCRETNCKPVIAHKKLRYNKYISDTKASVKCVCVCTTAS